MTIYSGAIEMGLGFAAEDFYVVTYSFTTGSGLVTKFRMDSPTSTNFLGEDNSANELFVAGQYTLQWGGNVILSPGYEQILFRRSAFSSGYPNATSAVFEVRAGYFAAAGTAPVVISVQSYVGGTMVNTPPTWSNVGYTSTRTDYPTFSKVVTTGGIGTNPFAPGEFMTNLQINFTSGNISYS